MSSAYAKRLCPDLIIIPPRFPAYRTVSKEIMAIYHDITDIVEPLSLDEAYLDVTHISLFRNSATRMAQEIRRRVVNEIGITVSAGVAPNKFLAKIASDWKKPNGLFVIEPEMVDTFVAALPVKKLHGVGKVTAQKLEKMGILTCAQLREVPLPQLIQQFGKFGHHLSSLAHGVDHRKIEPHHDRKSVSVERTWPTDLPDLAACQEALPGLFELLTGRLQGIEKQVDKLFIKLKFSDFTRTTVECIAHRPSLEEYQSLCQIAFARKNAPVRLIGMGVRLGEDISSQQLSLFGEES
jgi:DNA polymerase-4